MRILMIDDEPYMLWLYQTLQDEGSGHEVVWARDSVDAREKMYEQSFDMVIVDVLMPAPTDSRDPEGDSHVLGLRLCQDILATGWGSKARRIVVLSVLTENEFRERAKRIGLDPDSVSFVSKDPFPDISVILGGPTTSEGDS